MRKLNVNSTMPWPQKSTVQAKRIPPPAVPSTNEINSIQRNIDASTAINDGNTLSSSTTSTVGGGGVASDKNCFAYSSMEDGGFTQTRDCPAALSIKDEAVDFPALQPGISGAGVVTSHSKSPSISSSNAASSNNPYVNANTFSFPILGHRSGEPLTHKAAVFYHQQLALQEDQGIDLTQSPGRDSPGSSSGSAGSGSRHSTASLDSGRASSYITSSGTVSTRGALSSPRCSVSSCSIGSVDRMSQRSDNDAITDWLIDIKFDEYIQLFTAAGYDLSTIARMTPEDLTAIGIKNPHHREKLKQHIDNLQVPDGLPNFVPGSIEEWLRLLRLDEYIQPLLEQNYKTVSDVTQVTWEDLEDIGIVKLGHQKKILLAIKRVKDIISGKWKMKGGANNQNMSQYFSIQPQQTTTLSTTLNAVLLQPPSSASNQNQQQENFDAFSQYHKSLCQCQIIKQIQGEISYPNASQSQTVNANYMQTNSTILNSDELSIQKNVTFWNPYLVMESNCIEKSDMNQEIDLYGPKTDSIKHRISWDENSSRMKKVALPDKDGIINECKSTSSNTESNDIVLIKIRHPRGKSLESLEDLSERNIRTHLTFSHYSTDYTYFPQHMQMHPAHQFHQQQQQQHMPISDINGKNFCINPNYAFHIGTTQWRRSYDDGDITPTNEISVISGQANDLIEGGGTLPRQRGGSASARCRLLERNTISTSPSPANVLGGGSSGGCLNDNPISGCGGGGMILSATNQSGKNQIVSQDMMQQSAAMNYNCMQQQQQAQDNVILMPSSVRYTTGNSPLGSKKQRPEPPRRQCSIRQTGRSTSLQEQSSTNSLIPVMANVSLQQQQQQAHSSCYQSTVHLNPIGNCNLLQQNAGSIANLNPNSNLTTSAGGRNIQQYQQVCYLAQTQQQQQQQQKQQPIYVNYSNIHQTKAEVHCEQTYDNKTFQSNSSIDSIDTIPFANENTGTIKQRILNRQDISSSLSLSSSSSSSSSSTNTIANIAQSFHSLKSSGSLHETTLHGLVISGGCGGAGSAGVGLNQNNYSNRTNNCSGNIGDINLIDNTPLSPTMVTTTILPLYSPPTHVGCPDATCVDTTDLIRSAVMPNLSAPANISANPNKENQQQLANKNNAITTTATTDSANVLNDIGNMLANLTDELDAMLEEEKRVGISDSE